MGDRGNIILQYEGKPNKRIYLYSHWAGSDIKSIVASALDRGRGRWNDEPYLARIIFCELIKGDADGETGYGIDIEPGDNEHPFLVVDLKNQTLFEEPDKRDGFGYFPKTDKDLDPVTFEEFIATQLKPA